ncbi:MAG: hypothetical protein JXX14_23420 [Deltaproteobacteria bacterium]|nr:hypothetical protein [Deltaproteobacteria bacterium]
MTRTFLWAMCCAFWVMGCYHSNSGGEDDGSGQCDCGISVDNETVSGTDSCDRGADTVAVTVNDDDSSVIAEANGDTSEETDAFAGVGTTQDTDMFCTAASDCFVYPWVVTPHATGLVAIRANLDAGVPPTTQRWNVADPSFDPGVSSNFSTAITVYDSAGRQTRLDIYFARSGDWEWNYYVVCDAGVLEGDGMPGYYALISWGRLAFATSGSLYSETVEQAANVHFKGTGAAQAIAFDFGSSIVEGDCGTNGVVMLEDSSVLLIQQQDGHDGSGNWMCAQNRCVQNFYLCAARLGIGCCGDGTCFAEDGKSIDTCARDCNWQCRTDADCAGRPWDSAAKATSYIELSLNLNAGTKILTEPWNPSTPEQTSNHSEQVTVYDSVGNPHLATVYFRKERVNGWTWYGLVDQNNIINADAKHQVLFAAGTLQFTDDGFCETAEQEKSVPVDFTDADAGQSIVVYFTDPTAVRLNTLQTTQFYNYSILYSLTQDGHNGTGRWQCDSEHQCAPLYDPCGVPLSAGCCGDNVCKIDMGMDGATCPASCDSN